MLIALGVAVVWAGGATAAAAAPKPNAIVTVSEAPFSDVVGATVVARDDRGQIVDRATTGSMGLALLRLPRGVTPAHPITVSITGGRYAPQPDGPKTRAFEGTLMTEIGTIGLRHPHSASLATTAAVQLRDTIGGTYRSRLNRVARALGARPARLAAFADPLSTYSYAVGIGKLRRALRDVGGHDAFVARIAAAVTSGTRIRGLRATKLTFPHVRNRHFASQRQPRATAPSLRQSSSGTTSPGGPGGAPCTSTVASPPPPSLPTTGQDVESVVNISLSMSEGLFALADGDPVPLTSAIYGSVTGNAFGPQQTQVSTNELQTDLQAISQQLDCISTQIAALQTLLEAVSLQISLSALATCESAVATAFEDYQSAVTMVSQGTSPTSKAVRALMSNTSGGSIYSGLLSGCEGGLINQGLFNESGGQTAAWPQLLTVATEGTFVSSDSTALSPQTIESLQLFLQYWGTIEYQQSAMLNDVYNYACTYLGEPQLCRAGGLQSVDMGVNGCLGTTPSIAAIDPSAAASWCEWQQNIAAVWPGVVYSDEILQYGGAPTSGNTLGGEAWMAVPISLAYQALNPWNSPGTQCEAIDWFGTTEYFCADNDYSLSWYFLCTQTSCGPKGYGFGTLAANALANFQTLPLQPPQQPASVTETYYQPQTTDRTVVNFSNQPWSSGIADILESALDDAATAYATAPNGAPSFGITAFVGSTSVYNSAAYGTYSEGDDQYEWTCQSTWTGAPSTNPVTDVTKQEAGDETGDCGGPNAAVAVLLSRPWTQGTTWTPLPVVGTPTSSTVAGSTVVQLVATNCPSAGCVWGIQSTLPSGVTFNQTTGQLTIPTGTEPFTIPAIAANNYAVSATAALTVGPVASAS